MKDTWDGEQDPLAALRAGRPEPFESFVRSETPGLLAFFLRLGASRAEAEDLLQELFLKLFQQTSSYERQGRFVPFVFRIARNAWIDRVRRRALRGPVQGAGPRAGTSPERPARPARTGQGEDARGPESGRIEWAASREVDPAVHAARSEEVETLRRAWSRLPQHHRLVFELGVLQERSYQEISEALDVPVGTVKSRMFYALRRLREAAAPETAEGGA